VAFPEYTPVIDCVPPASAVVAQVATPEPLSAAVPQPVMVVPLARKLTVPAGVPTTCSTRQNKQSMVTVNIPVCAATC
jgi:hypothetical protein